MVRINIIDPINLTDQHLIAEYNEILMLVGSIPKLKNKNIPSSYCLGKGHITFFKDKLKYLEKRHNLIKLEMKIRGFKTNKSIDISKFENSLQKDWNPKKDDFKIIKQRIAEKIKMKPEFYRYYRKNQTKTFLLDLLKK